MGFNAPTAEPSISSDQWDQRQRSASGAEGYNQNLTTQIQQLPSFQAWVRSLQQPGLHSTGAGTGGTPEWKAFQADVKARGIPIPEDEIIDGSTGTVRGKTWTERHPVLSAVLITAGFAAGGVGLAALSGGGGGAGAAGLASAGTTGTSAAAGLGPTTAGSIAGTTAAAGGSTVPAALATTAPTIAGAGAAGTGSSAAMKFLNSPAGASLVSGGLQAGMGIANNNASAADAAAQRRQQLQMLLSQITGDQQQENLTRDTTYLNSTQQDPVKQQKDLMRAGVMKVLAQNGAPQVQRGGVTNTPDLSGPANQYLSDPALAAAAQRFYTAAGIESNNAPIADLSSMGFKTDTSGLQNQMNTSVNNARQGRVDLNQQRRDELLGLLTGGNTQTSSPTTPSPSVTPPPSPVAPVAPTAPAGNTQSLLNKLQPTASPTPTVNPRIDYFNRKRNANAYQ